jgi:hypothetical protein
VCPYAVGQLVQALRYKSEGRGVNSRWEKLEFFIDLIFPAAGVDSASNRNEYQRYSWEGGGMVGAWG